MNNFAIITKAEKDVAKAKNHLSVLRQNITDSKKKLEEAKAAYDSCVVTTSDDHSGLHELILSVDLIKVELNKANASLEQINEDIISAKNTSKEASEVYSQAKEVTIKLGNDFYDEKKKADSFKDNINKATSELNEAKASYDQYLGAADNSQGKIDEQKAALAELQKQYSDSVAAIQELQEEYDKNMSLISGRKSMLEKAEAEEAEKKADYEQKRSEETIKKVAYDKIIESQNRLKPAYEEAVSAENAAKEAYDNAVSELDKAKKDYEDAINDEAAKEKNYNNQVDSGRDSHNYEFDTILDNLRNQQKLLESTKDFTINNPDVQDYCKDLILYNLNVCGNTDITFGDWIINFRGMGGLSYIPVNYSINGLPVRNNFSCECKKEGNNRVIISECDLSDMSNITRIPFISEQDINNGNDVYQLSLKSLQDDINRAEINYNNAKVTTDHAAIHLEESKKVIPELKTAYEKAVKNSESIIMNYNTSRAMVNKAKAEYDEKAQITAEAYNIFNEYKEKADSYLAEYNRLTESTSSFNINYENAKKKSEKILNDIDHVKSNIKKLDEFGSDSVSVLNKAKDKYEEVLRNYEAVQTEQANAAKNLPQIKAQLDEAIAQEEIKKKAVEDSLANEMNLQKKLKQTKEEINKIRFRLNEANDKLTKAQASSDASGRTKDSLKLAYDIAKAEYEKADFVYSQSNSICNALSKTYYKLNYETTRSDFNQNDYNAAKKTYDDTLMEFTNLTGVTFNFTDESSTDESDSDKSSDLSKDKGLFTKFFGKKK